MTRLLAIWWTNTKTRHLRAIQPAERVRVAAESRLNGLRDRVTWVTPWGMQNVAIGHEQMTHSQLSEYGAQFIGQSRCGGVRT